MYESLTSLLPKLQGAEFGEWIIDRENAGSPEHPKQFPFVAYGRSVTDLENAIYRFIDEHKEMELTRYVDILEEANIKNLYPASDMDDGAKKVIRLVKENKK